MKKKFAALSVAITTLLFISCSKDPKPTACTTNAAAISGTYKITAATYKASSTAPEIDYLNILLDEPCLRDNVFTFNSNYTYQSKDLGIVCSPNGSNNGTWDLAGTTTLQLDGDDLDIESFDCKDLILAISYYDIPGDRLKFTFTKQ